MAEVLKKLAETTRTTVGEPQRMLGQLANQVRATHGGLTAELAKVRTSRAKAEMEAKQKEVEQRDAQMLQEMMPEATEKANKAEDLVEKAAITSEMIAAGGDNLDEVQRGVTETETAAKQAQAAIGEARIFINAKQASVKRLESEKVRTTATTELAKLQQQLQEAQNKLNPLKTVRQDFMQRQATKRVIDEILQTLNPAEVDCDRADEATALLSGTGLSKETLQQAEQAVRKATDQVAAGVRLFEQRKAQAAGLVMAEVEKLETRVKAVENRVQQLKIAHREGAERVTCELLLKEAAEKLQSVQESVTRAADAEGPFLMGVEELPLDETMTAVKACETAATSANTSVSICRMFLATKVVEAKRFSEKPSQETTSKLKDLQKQLEAYDTRLKSMKVPTLNSQDKSKLKELEKLINSRSGELGDIQAKHHAVEEEVRELHNQIMNIGGEELRQAKAKVEEATKKCEDMRRNIKKSYLDADNMVKNSKKAEANAKRATEERAGAEKTLANLKKEHAALDDKAEVVLNSYNQLQKTLAQKDQLLGQLKEQRDKIIQEASAAKSQEVDLVNEMEEKQRTLKELYGRITAWGNKLQEARKEYKQLPLDFLSELRSTQAAIAATETEAVVQANDMGQELARRAIHTDLSETELKRVVRADCDARMLQLEANVKNLKPNLSSIEEFKRADAEHRARLGDYEEVHSQREEARRKLEGLRQTRLEEFMDGFSVISMKLKEMYQMITLGGDAELELVDTLDPFSEGINFSVRPPKKSWKQITNLSGGEKTLASLSLVFALHHYKPTPLYFMDEIDAALDFRNVSIIANYIKERTKNAQFIVISLRNHMFELADLLVGIYKTQDVSKSVAINPSAFEVKKPPPLQDANCEGTHGAGAKRPLPPIEGPPATVRRTAAGGKEN
uniref:Structural maintenance of chromosomes protein 4 n=1 Tax=Alexandrium monilatum TaxID=311494 RepID=A0A7S4S093_9DINO